MLGLGLGTRLGLGTGPGSKEISSERTAEGADATDQLLIEVGGGGLRESAARTRSSLAVGGI